MSRNTPTLASVLVAILDARLADVHVAIPARVETFDATRRCVTAQPLIRHGHTDGETGERTVERLPVINDVPVVFPGSGSFSVDWPIVKGDTGLLVFSEASIDKWLTRGGDVDPLDDRRHALSDAIFIPGLRSLNAPPGPAAPPGTMVLRTSGEIHAGGSQALALRSEINDLRAFVATQFSPTGHTHTCASAGNPTTATVSSGAPPVASYPGTAVLKGA